MNELALFAGAGGGILGGIAHGWRTVCAVEIERYARDVLLARQNDRMLEPFPIWNDVRTFDGKPWRGLVDVVSGGFPCQDISTARAMCGREGLAGERSGLWGQMLRIIGEIQPPYVFGENSPALRTNGLNEVVEGLTSIGYDCRWITLGADVVGLNHRRKRLWFYASHSDSKGLEGHDWNGDCSPRWQDEIGQASDVGFSICERCGCVFESECGKYGCSNCEFEGPGGNYNYGTGLLPRVAGVVDGVANRVDRLKAIGNGQVPAVAALAWEILHVKKDK